METHITSDWMFTILVTKDGNFDLTAKPPIIAEEIEKLMNA
ncbi:hypothetical protein [Pedobacter namyangjuensis]|nr:hypothetical protein [Pedobacter namyangjuensis]